MGLQTPLLAEQNQEEAPSLGGLGGAPDPALDDEDSPLSRLIAQSTPASALMPYSASLNETQPAQVQYGYAGPSFVTILSGCLLVLNWGFLWGSYFEAGNGDVGRGGWLDTHLQIFIGWQEKYLPFLDKHTDAVIVETSVFSLSSNLQQDKAYVAMFGLWLCTVILPCVFMIVFPIWIMSDHNLRVGQPNGRATTLPYHHRPQVRTGLELTIRLSLMVAFLLLFLDVAISGIELEWEDTRILVKNRIRGPYVAYVLGCTCAMVAVVLLRVPYLDHLIICGRPQPPSQSQHPPSQHDANNNPNAPMTIRAPPQQAFRLPWMTAGETGGIMTADTAPLIEIVPTHFGTSAGAYGTSTSTNLNSHHGMHSLPPQPVSFRQKVIVYQFGILALILYLPALILPTFRVLYDGLVVDLVKNKAFNMYLWQMPGHLWKSQLEADTPLWMLLVVYGISFVLVVVVPILAHWVAALTWLRGNSESRAKWRDWLRLLHPLLCGPPLAIGMYAVVPSFIDIGENIDEIVCEKIEHVVESQCLISGGILLAGAWFLIAQVICLEVFVVLTLRWTAPKCAPHRTV